MKRFTIDGKMLKVTAEFDKIMAYHPSVRFTDENKEFLKDWFGVDILVFLQVPKIEKQGIWLFGQAHWDKERQQWVYEYETDGREIWYKEEFYPYPKTLSWLIRDNICCQCGEFVAHGWYECPEYIQEQVDDIMPKIMKYLGDFAESQYKELTVDKIVNSHRMIFKDYYYDDYYYDQLIKARYQNKIKLA